jgi:hypothetical protein
MPSTTPRQQHFFGAELGRERAGLKTQTGLPEAKLKDFAKSVKKPNPGPKKKPLVAPGTPKIPPMRHMPTVAPMGPMPKMKAMAPMAPNRPRGLPELEMAIKRPNPVGRY